MQTNRIMLSFGWLLWAWFVLPLVNTITIEVPECPQPDYPMYGGYAPRKSKYTAGDKVVYYCEMRSILDGNRTRLCSDNGDWNVDAPFCDPPARLNGQEQSTTLEPEEENRADLATDGLKSTCSSTQKGNGSYWMGHINKATWVVRVSVFMPKGPMAFSVTTVKSNGYEGLCGPQRTYEKDMLGWVVQTCGNPNNSDIVAIKVTSLSDQPIQLCEITVHAYFGPYCRQPNILVENGHLAITRTHASVLCNNGFSKSDTEGLKCLRNFIWTRKPLYCKESPVVCDCEQVCSQKANVGLKRTIDDIDDTAIIFSASDVDVLPRVDPSPEERRENFESDSNSNRQRVKKVRKTWKHPGGRTFLDP